MNISLENIGKRYRRDWIFRGIDYQFNHGEKYAITGPNGSGKSTFLKIIASHLTPTKGKISFSKMSGTSTGKTDSAIVYKSLSFAAPYIELLEEFSLREVLDFHLKFKKNQDNLTAEDLIELTGLTASAEKQLRFFSSGMKQRVKLAIAICSDSSLLLLDEPSTNLDREGIDWYRKLIKKYAAGRTVIIASNVDEDFDFCENRLNIRDFKKK